MNRTRLKTARGEQRRTGTGPGVGDSFCRGSFTTRPWTGRARLRRRRRLRLGKEGHLHLAVVRVRGGVAVAVAVVRSSSSSSSSKSKKRHAGRRRLRLDQVGFDEADIDAVHSWRARSVRPSVCTHALAPSLTFKTGWASDLPGDTLAGEPGQVSASRQARVHPAYHYDFYQQWWHSRMSE
ncbi:hypothetical protein VTO42DRAFT_4080 [Malbranchea cinnamomea]